MGKGFRTIRILVTAVFGTVFGLAIGAALVAVIATGFFDYHVVTVVSTSMEPALKKGDIVVTKPVTVSKLKAGDVIMFQNAKGVPPTIHRIVAVNTVDQNVLNPQTKAVEATFHRYFYKTKGDNNTGVDAGSVADNTVMGEELFSIPTFGLISDGTNPHQLMIGLVIVIGILWAAWEIGARLWKRRPGGGDAPAPKAPPPPTDDADDWSPESGLAGSSFTRAAQVHDQPANAPPERTHSAPEHRA